MPEIEAFTYSRRFQAPRALVYEVHSKAEHIAKWFGPAGSKTSKFDMDFRVGGKNHYCIEIPGGVQMWGIQTYRDIVPTEKIVHIQSFSDKDGGIVPSPMSPTWPREMLATTTFEDDGDGTKITVSWLPYQSDEAGISMFNSARPSMSGGFKGSFDALENYLNQLV